MPNESQTNDGGGDAVGRAAGADRRGDAAAVRLDPRTHLDGGRYRIVLRDYGGGLGEIGWSFIPVNVPGKAGRGESKSAEDNRDRATRRARSRLRHLILDTCRPPAHAHVPQQPGRLRAGLRRPRQVYPDRQRTKAGLDLHRGCRAPEPRRLALAFSGEGATGRCAAAGVLAAGGRRRQH